jgi:hypothetical protein
LKSESASVYQSSDMSRTDTVYFRELNMPPLSNLAIGQGVQKQPTPQLDAPKLYSNQPSPAQPPAPQAAPPELSIQSWGASANASPARESALPQPRAVAPQTWQPGQSIRFGGSPAPQQPPLPQAPTQTPVYGQQGQQPQHHQQIPAQGQGQQTWDRASGIRFG